MIEMHFRWTQFGRVFQISTVSISYKIIDKVNYPITSLLDIRLKNFTSNEITAQD